MLKQNTRSSFGLITMSPAYSCRSSMPPSGRSANDTELLTPRATKISARCQPWLGGGLRCGPAVGLGFGADAECSQKCDGGQNARHRCVCGVLFRDDAG